MSHSVTGLKLSLKAIDQLQEWTLTNNFGRWGRIYLIGKTMLAHAALSFGTPACCLALMIYDLAQTIFAVVHCQPFKAINHLKSLSITFICGSLLTLIGIVSFISLLPFYAADLALNGIHCCFTRSELSSISHEEAKAYALSHSLFLALLSWRIEGKLAANHLNTSFKVFLCTAESLPFLISASEKSLTI